ncbi:HPP family protein [Paenibacillus athensensis]|uniref:HPP family protein n=1 Tax=Paenibacillus athensensis TaxID=1967502 RepID=A0A4Y8PSR4_9BACL|nr:HPP family protein [Paenibacillus athensensis]MCD1258604.1 HPP family protein [Paenibacillus athensensis]
MKLKMAAISLYIVLIYYFSLHVPLLHMLFFPTLGAFSLLFVSRSQDVRELSKIAAGAFIASIIGTALFHLGNGGVLSLFITIIVISWLIIKLKWNAPPILAVSLIPFFAHAPNVWIVPVSVCGSMAGLLATLGLVSLLERRISPLAQRLQGLALFAPKRREWSESE